MVTNKKAGERSASPPKNVNGKIHDGGKKGEELQNSDAGVIDLGHDGVFNGKVAGKNHAAAADDDQANGAKGGEALGSRGFERLEHPVQQHDKKGNNKHAICLPVEHAGGCGEQVHKNAHDALHKHDGHLEAGQAMTAQDSRQLFRAHTQCMQCGLKGRM